MSVVKLRNSSSIQVRSSPGSTAAVKLPGSIAWTTVYMYANAHATSVNVAPTANSSSVVISRSASMYLTSAKAAYR